MPVTASDLVCFSHLPWDHVFQRPHHLMTRAARERRVFYVEEPGDGPRPAVTARHREGVTVVSWTVPIDRSEEDRRAILGDLMDRFVATHGIEDAIHWFYTPLALRWAGHLLARVVVYDCMDELSGFRNAPASLRELEPELFRRADIVFTGGQSLFESKRRLHPRVHPFPSAVDALHFAAAREPGEDPHDQASLPRPRLGWFGVIDERFDAQLVDAVAARRPDWTVVLVGPVAKIDPASLPRRSNVHYLGQRRYHELPAYLRGWDVAIMPFARNDATAFISPTKTPEYLAGGRPVVSTPIRDVVHPYGERGLVRIAADADAFVAACEAAMEEDAAARTERVDAFLEDVSWDRTWARMWALVEQASGGKRLVDRAGRALRRVPGVMTGVTGHVGSPGTPTPVPLRVAASRTVADASRVRQGSSR